MNLFQKKKLVGNVPAQIRLPLNKLAVYHYMLYEKGSHRSYEITFTHNKHLLIRYYTQLHITSPLEDFVGKTHKVWHEVVHPWLSGSSLNTLYIADSSGQSPSCKYILH